MRFLVFSVIILLLVSCNNDNKVPDVSAIQTEVKISRFEKDLFNTDTLRLPQSLSPLQPKYPQFLPFFLDKILGLKRGTAAIDSGLTQFIRWYAGVNEDAQQKYGDLSQLEKELEKAFKYVKYYFPHYKLLPAITYVGPFEAPGVLLTADNMAIGLQQFMGRDYAAYNSEALQQMYPAYISRRFEAAYIPAACLKAIADDIYPDTSSGGSLIEQMIEKGKQWYLLDGFMPGAADSLKTGFTQKQLDWCKANEGAVWAAISSNDLYTIDVETIQQLIGEAPFTQGMPEASPGNIGQWVGWQIVKKYAAQNSAMHLPQVVATPARELFAAAKYKPK